MSNKYVEAVTGFIHIVIADVSCVFLSSKYVEAVVSMLKPRRVSLNMVLSQLLRQANEPQAAANRPTLNIIIIISIMYFSTTNPYQLLLNS